MIPQQQWIRAIEPKPDKIIIEGEASEAFMQKVCLKILKDLPPHLRNPLLNAYNTKENTND